MSTRFSLFHSKNASVAMSDDFWSEYLKQLKENRKNQPSSTHEKQLKQQITGKRNSLELTCSLMSQFSDNNLSKAFKFIRFWDLSMDSKLITTNNFYRQLPPSASNWEISLIGIDNWRNVMCYLDSLLFAMFARMESFDHLILPSALECSDAMAPELRVQITELKTLLRFIVNLLRAGELITTDIIQLLSSKLAKLGCEFCMSGKQQDSLMMFESLMECLGLPLLTLKIDIIHRGKFNLNDDLRFINERCLLISVPEDADDSPIPLEDCLNSYFNNNITVKRHIDRRRTLDSQRRPSESLHSIESSELDDSELCHYQEEGLVKEVSPSESQLEKVPSHNTLNGVFSNDSTIRSEISVETGSSPSRVPFPKLKKHESISKVSDILERSRTRSSTIVSVLNSAAQGQSMTRLSRRESSFSNEVNLPAWMFLQLLPYYPDPDVELKPKNEEHAYGGADADVSVDPHDDTSQLSRATRPIVPICLKRYTWKESGRKIKRKVLIPAIIKQPYFISEDNKNSDGVVHFRRDNSMQAPCGSFLLVLESCVCHRGSSVNAGHYVSLTRKYPFRVQQLKEGRSQEEEPWLLFNDLEKPKEKIKEMTFKEAMDCEFPYLLFYRIVEIEDQDLDDPPAVQVNMPDGSREKFWTESDDSAANTLSNRKDSYLSELSIQTNTPSLVPSQESHKGNDPVSLEERLNSHRRHHLHHAHFLSRSVSRSRKREDVAEKSESYVDPQEFYYFYSSDHDGNFGKTEEELKSIQLLSSGKSKTAESSSSTDNFSEHINTALLRLNTRGTGSADDVIVPPITITKTLTKSSLEPAVVPLKMNGSSAIAERSGTVSIPILSPAVSLTNSESKASIKSNKTVSGTQNFTVQKSKNRLLTKKKKTPQSSLSHKIKVKGSDKDCTIV